MKRFLIHSLLCVALLMGCLFAQRSSTDPYQFANSARSFGMGKTSVAVLNDSLGLFSNPASIAKAEKFQFGMFSYKLFNEYSYFGISSVIIQDWGKLGLTYMSVGINGIPETDIIVEGSEVRIFQTDSFDFKEDIIAATYIVYEGENMIGLQNVDVGVTGKYVTSTLAGSSSSGIGIDVGMRFSVGSRWFEGIRFGLAFQNLVGPKFKALGEEEASESTYDANFRFGAAKKFILWDQSILGAFDFDNNGIHFGGEYYLDKTYRIRMGYDVSNFTFGAGLRVFTFTGFDYKPYTIDLDYGFHLYQAPVENLHLFSFSVLGVTQTKTPTIILPTSGLSVTTNLVDFQT